MDEEKQGVREPVDNPDSLKGDPIPGGPTDPVAGRPEAERNSV
jgi:hypothetical protein